MPNAVKSQGPCATNAGVCICGMGPPSATSENHFRDGTSTLVAQLRSRRTSGQNRHMPTFMLSITHPTLEHFSHRCSISRDCTCIQIFALKGWMEGHDWWWSGSVIFSQFLTLILNDQDKWFLSCFNPTTKCRPNQLLKQLNYLYLTPHATSL